MYKYDKNNCGVRCAVKNQLTVNCVSHKSENELWKVDGILAIHPSFNLNRQYFKYDHNDL